MAQPLLKILVIDGAAQERGLYRQWLAADSSTSYDIFEAATAEMGQALAMLHRPNGILVEQGLLDDTGLLTPAMEELALPSAIVVLAREGNVKTAVRVLKAGAQDYLAKADLTPVVLIQAVGAAIAKAQRSRQSQPPLSQAGVAPYATDRRSRQIIDSLFSFVGVVSLDGILLEANRAALEAAELRPEQVIGKPFDQAYWWAASEAEQERLRQAITKAAAGQMVRYEAVVQVKDNLLITIDFTLVPVKNDAGQVEYLIPSGIDITDHKRAERQLRQNQVVITQQLHEIEEVYHNSPIGLALLDRELRFVRINRHLAEINGIAAADHIGRSLRELLPSLADSMEPLLQGVVDTGLPAIDLEVRGETPAQPGVERVWLGRWYPFYGGQDEIIGVNIVAQEITDRKRTEASLASSKRRYETLFNSIDNGFSIVEMIFDAAGHPIDFRFLEVNPAFAEHTGLSVDAVGKTVLELIPDLEPHWIEQYGQVALTGESVRFDEGSEVLDRWFEVYACRLGEPESHQVAIVFNDVSDRKRIEQGKERFLAQTQAAKEEAENASRLKDEFLAIVSHELRTPLNPILGWSQLLIRGRLDAEKAAHALTIIERNAKLQAQLIDDLLDVSRILRGKLSLKLLPVNLETVVEAAIDNSRLLAEAKSIQIEIHKAERATSVSGDAGRLQQIFLNLLTNAIKFTPEGGLIDIRLQAFEGTIQVAVQDTGKGIPAQFLPHVFDRFRQQDTTTTRAFSGLGLGLSIVKSLVNLHGGRVWVESPGDNNQGSTFTVALPALTPVQAPLETMVPASLQFLGGIRILLVDDEVDALEMTTFLLEDAGATVRAVCNARDALVCLNEAPFDLLISDVAMPDMDGYQLIDCVRTQSALPVAAIPAIALTAYANEVDHQRAMMAGFQRHLSKPVAAELLLTAVANLLEKALPPSR